MKKFLLLASLFAVAICCRAELKQALILHMATGAADIVYFLDETPAIGFEGQTMVVTAGTEASSRSIPMEDVDRWEIGMADFDGISVATADAQTRIYVNGTDVVVTNPDNRLISVYTTSGQLVGTSTSAEATFSLAAGIYLVNIGNNTYKIATR